MRELVQPISIGLAARGSVEDTVTWAREARERGLNTVWFHDSYFERDAVTYATAVAAQVPDIRVGLGALNPFTRHPVLVAMTISALDEIAPNRITLGMGTGLPLRLAQMGIPYTPDNAVEEVSKSIDTMRALWAGQRIPSATPNLMPIQPMFPPVHQVPIYIAAYRKDFLTLTGQKADGYLARPCESLPGFSLIMKRIRDASVAAGRPADAVEASGYLLTLVDESRRTALNRAKREPFVIYMMAVLSDVSLKRAGFEPELRNQIMAAWRAEDYHRAAELIPDELLDAFMLCGTPNEVAEKAWQYHEAGMDIPALQPIVQEEKQVKLILDAAEIYGMGLRDSVLVPSVKNAVAASEAKTAVPAAAASVADESQLPLFERVRRHASAWFEIARPFSFTASMTPVMVAGALSLWDGNFNLTMFLYALIASVLLHMGTNVLNEIYDVRKGLDAITTPNASLALLKGRISEREAFVMVGVSFVLMMVFAVLMLMERGWPLLALGIIGVIGGYGYTAPPFQYKYHALGLPLVFLLMGPLMVLGGYFAITGLWSWTAILISIPVGLLVTAILHGNEWRDISDDARAGITTLSIRYGRNFAYKTYLGLIIGAYLALGMAVAFGGLPPMTLLALLSMPWLVRILRDTELGASGQIRAIAMIDKNTAELHSIFGTFMIAGLLLATVLLYFV